MSSNTFVRKLCKGRTLRLYASYVRDVHWNIWCLLIRLYASYVRDVHWNIWCLLIRLYSSYVRDVHYVCTLVM